MLARLAPRRGSTPSRKSPPPVWSCVLLRRLLYGGLVVSQCLGPEPLEVGAKGAHPLRVELVYAAGADRQLAGQLADWARAIGEALEDRPSRRVTEGGPTGSLVSLHAR